MYQPTLTEQDDREMPERLLVDEEYTEEEMEEARVENDKFITARMHKQAADAFNRLFGAYVDVDENGQLIQGFKF